MAARKVVEIEWLDAQSSLERMTVEEIKNELKPLYTKSVGYLIVDDKEYVVLGFTDFGDGIIKHQQLIPKKVIKKIMVVRDGYKEY